MKLKLKIHHYLSTIILILIISQVFTIYLILEKTTETFNAINESEEKLIQVIDSNNKDVQGKINILSTSIASVSSIQEDFQEELGEIKATTSADFSNIIEDEIQGVVTIKTDISQGTGFIITSSGYILTNYHVITGARAAAVFTYDTEQHEVGLIGFNQEMDIALLKIEGEFSNLDLGNSNDVKVGEKVIAIGNPLGLSFTATEGIISATERTGVNGLPYYFQTDVSLNPGNSGGPLINTKGEVIGVNNFKISGADNIGFALDINHAIATVNQISSQELNMSIV